MNKFDLHLHSKYSKDAIPRPESIAREALRKGLKGFAITDHNSTESFAEFKALQKKHKELLIVPGEEVKILEQGKPMGELLCYFLLQKIERASLGEILDAARAQDALVSVAHPFDSGRIEFRKDLEKSSGKLDAVEVFNARSFTERANELALKFAERRSMPFTAGSDAHSLKEIGIAGVECNAESAEELRKALLKRKCKVFGNERTSWIRQQIVSARARVAKE